MALEEFSISNQAKFLTDKLLQGHVKPRAVNDLFGKNVYDRWMNQFNPGEATFTEEDAERFVSPSAVFCVSTCKI